jgi:large subunit ribosomal protein L24
MQKIRKGDDVIVTTGKDKGKRGTVLRRVDDTHLLVEGVNRAKKHQKPNPMKNQTGGIVEMDMPIDISNVALFNPADAEGRPRRLQDAGGRAQGAHFQVQRRSSGRLREKTLWHAYTAITKRPWYPTW